MLETDDKRDAFLREFDTLADFVAPSDAYASPTDGDDDDPEFAREPDVQSVFGVEVARDEPAAVNAVDGRGRAALLGPVNPDRHLRVTGDRAVLELHAGHVRRR